MNNASDKSARAIKKSSKRHAKKTSVSAARLTALKTLIQVFNGRSLSAVQAQTIDKLDDARDRGLANEIVNGVLRWRWQLEAFTSLLMEKTLRPKDFDVQLVLWLALYEIKECRAPDYAIINDAVELVRLPDGKRPGKKWAAGLVNAVLRRFVREQEKLVASIRDGQAIYSHPRWILEKTKADWPKDWKQILEANNQRPAFWLRVNALQYSAEQYQALLAESDIASDITALSGVDHALKLHAGLDVRTLPGFENGTVSVQDVGAQLAAALLNVTADNRVLDLCAAPGGKTCHLLERHSAMDALTVVELEEKRMLRVRENLQRLKLASRVELIVADSCAYKQWWNGVQFDRILIDAPCSASGVIRRHPDIKTLRRDTDVATLVALQSEILSSAWHMLAPEGELLYVTCSVFKDENQHQIKNFLSQNNDAVEIVIDAGWGRACDFGRQLLPGEHDADGFYFCRIKKRL
ncbi:MAG: 16S rRNA (cytosine(967)-C(5))-methyltransferase RsmB [Gammaproteobacteria bacterium]|nr:16S rRNA (cytosine(967)-C(5))-methyltransferase RsmB [Gammaproteobacteria bacterium]